MLSVHAFLTKEYITHLDLFLFSSFDHNLKQFREIVIDFLSMPNEKDDDLLSRPVNFVDCAIISHSKAPEV